MLAAHPMGLGASVVQVSCYSHKRFLKNSASSVHFGNQKNLGSVFSEGADELTNKINELMNRENEFSSSIINLPWRHENHKIKQRRFLVDSRSSQINNQDEPSQKSITIK